MNPERKDATAVPKRLGKMYMVLYKLHSSNHVDRLRKANCNLHDRAELHGVSVCVRLSNFSLYDPTERHGVSVCLSLCPPVHRRISFFTGGGVRTSDCKGNRANSNTKTFGGRKLRTELQFIS